MMPINKLQKTIRKWLILQLMAIIAFTSYAYCGALTTTILYFFGSAAIANVHSVVLIDVGRSSGAKDTLASYEYSDLYNEKHYKIEGFAPAQKVNVGSKIDILFLKQLPDIAMSKSGVKIMAKESVSAIFIAFLLYFEATRRLFFLNH